jgi:CRP/FNR family transcriptional regulator, cyclic AMP receptor protein
MELSRLSSVPIFADLSPEELSKLAEICQTVTFSAEKVLTFQDEYAHKFFVILEGRASVWQEGRRVRDLGPGDFFGEVGLLTSGKRTATVATETDVELLVFMEWDVHTIETEWPSVGRRIREKLQERLEADTERAGGGGLPA